MQTLLIFVVYLLASTLAANTEHTIQTHFGNITGLSVTNDGVQVLIFLGLPYAEPPIGQLRFSKPKSHGGFPSGSFQATNYGPVCAQLNGSQAIGEEDCLTLNIFAPAMANLLPVMIWIHGGAFVEGAGSEYDGTILAATENVIAVTVNYRLNVLGFLTTSDATLPGNYGLWDQKLAIEWVKANIRDYGGNPDKITLFGESAGGRSISFQMFSPHNNRKLFQRAILESGTALSLTWLNRYPNAVTDNVTDIIGCSRLEDNFMECLRSKDFTELTLAGRNTTRPMPFFPMVDGDFLPNDLGYMYTNFTKNGVSAIRSQIGNFAQYELLCGWNSQEGLFYLRKYLPQLAKDYQRGITDEELSSALSYYPFHAFSGDSYGQTMVVESAKYFYKTRPQLSVSTGRSEAERRLDWYTDIAGDVAISLPSVQLLQLHSAVSNFSTYGFLYDYKPAESVIPYPGPKWLIVGANHADELLAVFGCPKCPLDQQQLSKDIMKHWASFARDGNPATNSTHRPWTEFTQAGEEYAHIYADHNEMKQFPQSDTNRFWRSMEMSNYITATGKLLNVTCETQTRSYLAGMFTTTMFGAEKVMTAIFVAIVLLSFISILMTISLISAKSQFARVSKKSS